MLKRLFKWVKILLIGGIWSSAYIYALVPLTRRLFFVDLLNPSDYSRLFQAFLDNRWQINSFGSVVLLFLILGFVPLWLVGWIVCYRKCPSLKSFKRKKKIKITSAGGLDGLPQRKAFIPEKMRTQAAVLLNMSLEEAQQKLKTNPSVSQNTAPANEADIRRDADIAKISAATADYELEVFSNLLFAGERVPLALSTDDRAALVWLVNEPHETWSVDLGEPIEKSTWYGTSRQLSSPIGILTKVCATLKESEPDSEIIPLVVLTSGRILNEAETLTACQAAGIRLAVFDEANSDLIPPLTTVLSELFLKKADTRQAETDPFNAPDSEKSNNELPAATIPVETPSAPGIPPLPPQPMPLRPTPPSAPASEAGTSSVPPPRLPNASV